MNVCQVCLRNVPVNGNVCVHKQIPVYGVCENCEAIPQDFRAIIRTINRTYNKVWLKENEDKITIALFGCFKGNLKNKVKLQDGDVTSIHKDAKGNDTIFVERGKYRCTTDLDLNMITPWTEFLSISDSGGNEPSS